MRQWKICRYCKEVKGWTGKGQESGCFTRKREEKETKKVETRFEDDRIEDEYITIVKVGKVEDEQGWQYDTGASAHTTKRILFIYLLSFKLRRENIA
jgi:hypothetical protein